MEKIIIIGGSAGSFVIINQLVKEIPASFKSALIICTHRLRNVRKGIIDTLSARTSLEVIEPFDTEKIKNSKIYIAPANYHLLIDKGHRFSLAVFNLFNHSRPSIDLTFDSAAEAFGDRVFGIILSGANNDGAYGLKKIKENGGVTIVQDPDEAEIKAMPSSAIEIVQPDLVLSAGKIITFIKNL